MVNYEGGWRQRGNARRLTFVNGILGTTRRGHRHQFDAQRRSSSSTWSLMVVVLGVMQARWE
jgi:hypothetical protein